MAKRRACVVDGKRMRGVNLARNLVYLVLGEGEGWGGLKHERRDVREDAD